MPNPLKPLHHQLEPVRCEVNVLAVLRHHRQPKSPPDHVAQRDAADAAAECSDPGGRGMKRPALDHGSSENHDRLVWNRKSHNSQHQQKEQRDVTVLRDPENDGFKHDVTNENRRMDVHPPAVKTLIESTYFLVTGAGGLA